MNPAIPMEILHVQDTTGDFHISTYEKSVLLIGCAYYNLNKECDISYSAYMFTVNHVTLHPKPEIAEM